MSTTAQIVKYKVVLDKIARHTGISKKDMDIVLKHSVGLEGSCKDFDKDQMNDLIESAYYTAIQIGLKVDDDDNIN